MLLATVLTLCYLNGGMPFYTNQPCPPNDHMSITGEVGSGLTSTSTVTGYCALGWEKVMRENQQVACAKSSELDNHPPSQ